jgi:hypothetical protein
VQDLVDLMQIGVKLKLNFVIATSKWYAPFYL